MSDPNRARIEAKIAETRARLAKFQNRNAATQRMFQSEPEPEVPKKPQQQKPVAQKPQPFTPKSAATPGGPSGLNLIELQRHIADAKNRLSQTNNASRTTPGGPYRVNDLKPPAIPLDESGQIDLKAMMDKGIIPRRETPNSLAKQKKAVKKTLTISEVPSDFSNPSKNPYFDPSMEVKVAPVERRSRQLKFVQPGKFIAIAEKERERIQLDKLKQEITESVKKAGMQTEFDVSDKAIKRDAPPAVEWWDAPFTANKTYDDLDEIHPEKFDTLVTMYVHHPVPTRPPSEVNAVPVIKSVMLTTKERKKLRRQKRAEEQKDKRDKIRLGLIEPDLPKVKISNLMRVLGEEAIQDPTKVEARVRREMQQRQRLHEKANEQRKLTPEERRAKISNKIKEDQRISNEIAIFKIKSCSHPKHRYKIEMNAQQHQLTGMVINNPKCNIVIVEGGPKGIKAYKKLMLRRIDWNDMPPPKNLESDETAMEVDQPTNSYGLQEGEQNSCYLVWAGQVKNKSFKKFTWRTFESEKMAREELSKWQVENYWDAAIMATDEELAARQPEFFEQN